MIFSVAACYLTYDVPHAVPQRPGVFVVVVVFIRLIFIFFSF